MKYADPFASRATVRSGVPAVLILDWRTGNSNGSRPHLATLQIKNSCEPKAQCQPSLGHRPRNSEGQRPVPSQPWATPKEQRPSTP